MAKPPTYLFSKLFVSKSPSDKTNRKRRSLSARPPVSPSIFFIPSVRFRPSVPRRVVAVASVGGVYEATPGSARGFFENLEFSGGPRNLAQYLVFCACIGPKSGPVAQESDACSQQLFAIAETQAGGFRGWVAQRPKEGAQTPVASRAAGRLGALGSRRRHRRAVMIAR